MDCPLRRFLPVMGLMAWGVASGFSAAQQSPQPPPPAPSGIAAGVVAGPRVNRGVQGLPYSADELTVTTQTLADGTIITHKRRVREYRDSEGRTRNEYFQWRAETGEPDDTPASIHIFDPVTGVNYELDPRNHTARKEEMSPSKPSPPPQTTAAPAYHPPAPPRPTVEDLGTQEMEGVNAQGTRTTRIIPAGAHGNDRPIQTTVESWYSRELHLALMTTVSDPRGESMIRVSNLVRDEPPAQLFQVPPDYTIEETQTVVTPSASPE